MTPASRGVTSQTVMAAEVSDTTRKDCDVSSGVIQFRPASARLSINMFLLSPLVIDVIATFHILVDPLLGAVD